MKPSLGVIVLKFSVLLVHAQLHDAHYDFWLHSPVETSVDIMTDVVNDLGVRILQQHIGPGNVAFSPTGVGFVLIALYEGSAGRGRQQIGQALGLPWRNQITRIGMRDINRRLKSYLNADGFLSGLMLNKENINIRPEYEDILRFYGFDLSFNMSSVNISNVKNTTEAPNSVRNTAGTSETAPNTITIDVNATPAISSTMATETPATMVAINNATEIISSNSNTPDATNSTESMAEETTLSVSTLERISQITTLATVRTEESESQSTTLVMNMETTTFASTILMNDPSSDTITASSTDSDSGISTVSAQTATNDASDTTTTVLPTTTNIPSVMTTNALPMMGNTMNSRRKRSASNANRYLYTYPDDGFWMQDLNIGQQFPRLHSDYNFGGDESHVSFLVNGCDAVPIPAATYSTILPFAYFPSLKATALEFPLDDPRYNIILFLPTEGIGTHRLIRYLGLKTLRLLRKNLQSTWVRATIPSFMLRGFVTLTPFLQRLGIKDVFEPRVADLSPMTPDLGVYARDVQQSIAVNIKSDMKVDEFNSRQAMALEASSPFTSRMNAYRFLHSVPELLERTGPSSFVVEHPFVYFIIDAHTSVSLIAGRVDDPLNSRII